MFTKFSAFASPDRAFYLYNQGYDIEDKGSGRGCTFLKAEGSFARDKKDVVLCACNNKQMYIIRTAIKEVDPNAFIIIMESNEVLGEGFKAH